MYRKVWGASPRLSARYLKKMETEETRFIDRTIQHIRKVQDNMILLEKNRQRLPFKVKKWELAHRGLLHDNTKFSKELVDGFVLINEFYRNKRLGLSNEDIEFSKLDHYFDAHRKLEKHHPDKDTEMDDVSLCEMCCDLVAMAQELNEEDFTQYYREVQIKNYPMLKQYDREILETLNLLQEITRVG